MAVQVTSTVKESTRLYKVSVTLTSITPIITPEYFVIHDPTTKQEVVAFAGLPSPPVFVTMVGSPHAIASKHAIPKPSDREGRMLMSDAL